MKWRVAVPLAAVALFVGCPGPDCDYTCAPVTNWDAILSGNNVVPPVSTSASGEARFRLDENDVLYFEIRVVGLTAAGDARLYIGAAGQNGYPRETLCEPCSVTNGILAAGRIPSQGTTPAALINNLRTFGAYVEIRNETRNGTVGLLRGQVRNVAYGQADASLLSPSP